MTLGKGMKMNVELTRLMAGRKIGDVFSNGNEVLVTLDNGDKIKFSNRGDDEGILVRRYEVKIIEQDIEI